MATVGRLKDRIESTEDLFSVVKTMKALAATNIRHYERAVASSVEYNRVIELGLQIVLHHWFDERTLSTIADPDPDSRLGAVVLGSDQGMVGQFNERIGDYALDTLNGLQIRFRDRSLLTAGERLTDYLLDARQPVEESFPVPASAEDIAFSVQDLLFHIDGWRSRQNINRILVFYNETRTGSTYEPQSVNLLPLDLAWLQRLEQEPWSSRSLPIFTMDPERLFSALVRQYFFVVLYRSFAESLASENASRLAAMQAAERNIEDRLDEYNVEYHRRRQSAITEELLDIVAGFEALAGAHPEA